MFNPKYKPKSQKY